MFRGIYFNQTFSDFLKQIDCFQLLTLLYLPVAIYLNKNYILYNMTLKKIHCSSSFTYYICRYICNCGYTCNHCRNIHNCRHIPHRKYLHNCEDISTIVEICCNISGLRVAYVYPQLWIHNCGSTIVDPQLWIHNCGSTFVDTHKRLASRLCVSTIVDPAVITAVTAVISIGFHGSTELETSFSLYW